MKNRKLNWILLLIISISFVGCSTYFFEDELPSILGVEKVEVESKTIYDELGGLKGEGMVLEEYKLSDKTIADFKANLTSSTEFNYKDKSIKWNKIPIDSSFMEPLSKIIDYKAFDSELYIKIEQIKALIHKPNTYYSIVFEDENEDYVQLFVFDLNTKTLFTIDQQM